MKPKIDSRRAALLLRRALLSLLLCAGLLSSVARGQTLQSASVEDERAGLHQALLDLSNSWTVMCVAAHPDDEDGATLTVLRRKFGVHTVTVFSTFGEGGQNATGPELYEELGAIRARETQAAASIQGSEAWFLALRDFGFSKSADEAFRIWGHEEALRRLVLKIRTLHPDVIITNHDTKSGHGHHQATGRLVLEAFDAAADARRFPEQLRQPGVTLWQAQRLFVRVNYESGTGSKAEEEEAARAGKVVTVNPNERDAVRGSTYAEQALQALHQHASQGPWPATVPAAGAPLIRYRLAREASGAAPLPANAPTILEGLRLPEAAAKFSPLMIDGQPLTSFMNERERVFKAIAARRAEQPLTGNSSSPVEPHLRLMNERMNRALAALSGITATLTSRDNVLVPNSGGRFALNLANRGDRAATIQRISFNGWVEKDLKAPSRLAPKSNIRVQAAAFARLDAELSLPREAHLYDGRLFGQQFDATVYLVVDGQSFSLPVTTRVDVAPAIEIAEIKPSPLVLTTETVLQPSTLTVRLVNHRHVPVEAEIKAEGLAFTATKSRARAGQRFRLAADETRDVKLEYVRPVDVERFKQTGAYLIPENAKLTVSSPDSSTPTMQREIRVTFMVAKVAQGLRVGYVRSFDDTLRNALDALGVKATELTIDEVRAGKLQGYDTIIIDNRGYQAHPELVAANARLLEYARAGGTLIVFYHKTGEWNPDAKKQRPQLAPYPIILDSSRVTDETAPIAFTEPQSALLNLPNKIRPEDFDGWIQERGLYYPKEWDAHYSAPLMTNDKGEAPLGGGLLAADYGRGRYIYTSMVWYRQLRAGVPGAYRVFANMISYGHTGAK